ncbi:MAG TPA: hypothetical protein VFG20_21845 [Planctomycetaceae bacterium]|nr:hypothetical protein [Planctomycetaceae bacterium]
MSTFYNTPVDRRPELTFEMHRPFSTAAWSQKFVLSQNFSLLTASGEV